MSEQLYRTIVADPPWPIAWHGGLAYPLMSIDEIKALPVGELAAAEAHLYLWVTPELQREGIGVAVARAWGFDIVGEIIWHKRNYGMGHFPRPAHEPLLVCRRGKLPFARNDVGSVQTWSQPYGRGNSGKVHSAKPDGAIDLIESSSPPPYLEVFARRARFGWAYAGEDSLATVELEGLRTARATAGR